MKRSLFLRLRGTVCVLAAAFWTGTGCDAIFNSTADPTPNEQLTNALTEASGGIGPSFFLLPDALEYDALPQDPRNPITREKVFLGQLLFHETGLAVNPRLSAGLEKYSCASCHHARAGFQSGIRQGIGEGGIGFGTSGEARTADPSYPESAMDVQPIRSPSILHVAYQTNMLWNGALGAGGANIGTEDRWTEGTPPANNQLGYSGVETQGIAGMSVHRFNVDTPKIKNNIVYRELFASAFPEVAESERMSRTTAGLAIAAFERTLVANQSPFQEWLRGRYWAMSDPQIRGALVFFGKAGCVQCHTGPALSSTTFAALGMSDLSGPDTFGPVSPTDPVHLGRGGFTGRESDRFKFKVPQLYNLADVPYYGHGSSFFRIRDVIVYKNMAQSQNAKVPAEHLDERFRPLGLTDSEIDDLTAFVSGALRDPSLLRYEPEYVPSLNCFPNNDTQTRRDLRCR